MFCIALLFSGCSSDTRDGAISTTGTDRVALFKDKVNSDINPRFDESGRREMDKAKFDKPARVAPKHNVPPARSSIVWVSDYCQDDDDIIVSRNFLHKILLPEEGGLECLKIDSTILAGNCLRNPWDKLKLEKYPIGVSVATSFPNQDEGSMSLYETHLTINLRAEQSLKQFQIHVMSCPARISLDSCLFEYSPKKFVQDSQYKYPVSFSPSQSLSLAQRESDIIVRAIEDILKPGTGRILGLIAIKREYTPIFNSCPLLEFYTIN
jgi:hypothetical protein